MKGFIIGTLATAVAFALLAWLLPQVTFDGDIVGLLVLSLVFGVVNGLIKPVVKLFALPINLMTLGLFGLVINAALLLLVAWVTEEMFSVTLSIGGFPQDGFSLGVVVDAFIASIVLTLIQAVVGLVVKDRR
jgi:putative membrane protein